MGTGDVQVYYGLSCVHGSVNPTAQIGKWTNYNSSQISGFAVHEL